MIARRPGCGGPSVRRVRGTSGIEGETGDRGGAGAPTSVSSSGPIP